MLIFMGHLWFFQVVSMDSKEYFFDNLRQLTDVIKKGKKVKEGEQYNILTTVINPTFYSVGAL